MKLKTQIVAIALALGVSTSLVSSQDRQPQQLRTATPTIVGVWQVVRNGINCNDPNQVLGTFPAILTFHSDGTMTGDTGGTDTTEYGSWQREPGTQNYSFRNVSYGYDENGDFAVSFVIAASVNLDTADSWTYSATIDVLDADGNLIFTVCGRGAATRFE